MTPAPATTVEGDDAHLRQRRRHAHGQRRQGRLLDVPTANATVHIIDTVLMPPAA